MVLSLREGRLGWGEAGLCVGSSGMACQEHCCNHERSGSLAMATVALVWSRSASGGA